MNCDKPTLKREMCIKITSLPESKEQEYAEKNYSNELQRQLEEQESKLSALSELSDVCNTSSSPDNPDITQKRTKRHPQTIKKYIAALLTFFSNVETEYVDKDGNIFFKKLPVIYATRERLISVSEHQFKELTNGNVNYLPRASLILDNMTHDPNRQINKSNNITEIISMRTLSGDSPYAEVQSAPTAYNLNLRMNILTRGKEDAFMIVEQICSRFNPFLNMQVHDNISGDSSDIRIQLESVTFEPLDEEDFSQNKVLTEISFIVYGNLYKASQKENLIENININLNI